MGPYRRNLIVLFFLQALSATGAVTLATVNGLAALAIAPSRNFATVPTTAFIVGAAASTYFASVLMERRGRAAGFRVGAICAVAGAIICALAISADSFWLLCFGAFLFGTYNAFAQYHRFAAAEVVPKALTGRAISWVMAAGIVGAVVGPESSKHTKNLTATPFVGVYLSLIAVALAAFVLSYVLALPAPAKKPAGHAGTPTSQLLRRVDVALAVASAVGGYAVMIFLMTATPLAMEQQHLAYHDTAWVIEWHVLGMFAPSFITGSVIRRFGVGRVILAGVVMMVGCVAVNFSGASTLHFWVALVLLGVGWNMMFVGGTALLADAVADADKSRAQGINETLVFVANAISSASSGVLLHFYGWQKMNAMAVPLLLPAVLLCVAFLRARRFR